MGKSVEYSEKAENHESKAEYWAKKVRTLTDRMVQLTGTPSPNGLIDVWSQMFLLDGGERLGKTMSAYKMRFFQTDHNGYTLKLVNNADKIIHRLIDDMVISLNVDDYLQMPERIDTVMRVNIPPARLAEYKQLERDFIMQINDTEIVAYNAATLAGKLLQYCNGAMYTDELKNWTEIHTAKLDALDEILEDNQDENLLIAYNYKTDLIRLKARYPDAVDLPMTTFLTNADKTKTMKVPYGQWYRCAPNWVDSRYIELDGFPFAQYTFDPYTDQHLLVKYDAYDHIFQSAQLGQYQIQAKSNCTVYRRFPSARDSVMTN